MKTSKVSMITANGTWESQYGLMYKFQVVMQNGDTGEYLSKSQDQNKFILGQEASYEYTGGDYPKIKPFNEGPPARTPEYSNKTNDSILYQVCLKECSAYFITNGFEELTERPNTVKERIDIITDAAAYMAKVSKENIKKL